MLLKGADFAGNSQGGNFQGAEFPGVWMVLNSSVQLLALPAVYNHGSSISRVVRSDTPPEGQQGSGVFRDTMIRPHSKMKLLHFSLFFFTFLVQTKVFNVMFSKAFVKANLTAILSLSSTVQGIEVE